VFLDEAIIEVRSGAGGPGATSFRREKYIPKGGPDGGDGGRGGHVYLRAVKQVTTLLDIGRRRIFAATSGEPGRGGNRTGRQGRDLTIDVPVGTVVREVAEGVEPREGHLVADLTRPGQRVRVATGGKGGKGNKAFAHATRQVPKFSQRGLPGESRRLYLELKLLADVGLVGLPNAGKSTLLSRISAATPKIGDYPFTTLKPSLGIVELADFTRLVFADIPGLIEGAHLGQGLGTEFLRHIERTRVLVQLVSAEEGDPEVCAAAFRTVEDELRLYSEILASKPRIVALSKVDVLAPDDREELRRRFSELIGRNVFAVSAVSGFGLPELLAESARIVGDERVEDEYAPA